MGHDRAAVHRPLQRPARDLRDRERQGPRRCLRRAQSHRWQSHPLRGHIAAEREARARLRPDSQRQASARPPWPRLRDRDRARAAHADSAWNEGGGRGDDLHPVVALDRACGALFHRVLAQPALHRGFRARARPAGGRFDRRRREHRAVPARRVHAVSRLRSRPPTRSRSPSSAAPRRCCSPSCRCCSCRKARGSSSVRCRHRCCTPWPRRCWSR